MSDLLTAFFAQRRAALELAAGDHRYEEWLIWRARVAELELICRWIGEHP